MVLEMRRAHPYWELAESPSSWLASRLNQRLQSQLCIAAWFGLRVIDPISRQRRRETWKRWERGAPMELWQL
jgi:hypothetical protein